MSAPRRNGPARHPDHDDVAADVRKRNIDGIRASVAERLGSASMRYTKTRRAVIDVLAQTCRPLTVDQVRSNIAAPQSTVYRTLAILEEFRLVHRLTSNTSDFARFELAEDLLGHHHHLECASCGTMIDITLADQPEADLLANAALGCWWADPVAALGIALIALVEAQRTWRAEALDDTCCA